MISDCKRPQDPSNIIILPSLSLMDQIQQITSVSSDKDCIIKVI